MHEDFRLAHAHHLAGRLSEAEALYRRMLEADPKDLRAMSMLGMMLMDTQRMDEAQALFTRMLEADPGHHHALHNLGRLMQIRANDIEAVQLLRKAAGSKPDFAPAHNDLAVSLHRLGKFEDALASLRRALEIDPGFAMAHDNLGVVLYDCGRYSQACDAHLRALEHTNDANRRISILLNLAAAAYEAGNPALSEKASLAILDADPQHAGAMEQLAKVMQRQGRNSEALELLNGLARMQGLEIREGPENPEATILVLGAVGASHVPTRWLFDESLFARLTLVMLSPDREDAPLGEVSWDDLADVDLIFNALGDAEMSGGQFEAVKDLSGKLGRPLLNSPDGVARTGRYHAPKLFGDIEGLRVPDMRRLARGEAHPEPPFLIRAAGTHGGKDLCLIRCEEEFFDYMKVTPGERFLLSEFVDFGDAEGCYRKYRFIFVDRRPYPYHLAIGEDWMVHYWRTDMRSVEWKRAEEAAFLHDWAGVFGPAGAAAVAEIGRRMDLEYGGLDCSILQDGRVLFFEANASMLVHLDDADPDCKRQAVFKIRDAVTRMIRERTKDRSSGRSLPTTSRS